MSAIYTVASDSLFAERAKIIAGIDSRITWQHENGNLVTIDALVKHKNRVAKLDNLTLAFIHTHPMIKSVDESGNVTPITYADMFTNQRRASQCFNEKAIPKVFRVAATLNGGAFAETGNDDETLSGVILALARGETNGKRIKNYLCDYMNRAGTGRVDWHSQDTQGSSSLRALEALGIVTRVDGKGTTWQIANPARFQRVCDAAKGFAYVPTPDDTTPVCDAASVSDDTSLHDAVTDALASCDVSGISYGAGIDALNTTPVLRLTYDAPFVAAPVAKAKRGGKNKNKVST